MAAAAEADGEQAANERGGGHSGGSFEQSKGSSPESYERERGFHSPTRVTVSGAHALRA